MVKANAINVATNGVVGFNGTGFTSSAATQYAVLTAGSTSSTITAVGPGTAGQILQSNGSASPTYSTATYPSSTAGAGKGIIADGTNWVETTPTFQNSSGTAGKFLISDGTNFITSTPTFPNASATSRKIIVSNGTNWIASTETYATPGTSGNVLTSDGTNWVSSAPSGGSGGLLFVTKTITNADLKAGNSTLLVAAPGSGNVIVCYYVILKFVYGGNNAFSSAPSSQIDFGPTWNTNNIVSFTGGTSFWQATSNQYWQTALTTVQTNAASAVENTGVYFNLNSGVTGNAAGDNTFKIQLAYYILSI